MNNITEENKCIACGICSSICPVQAISIKENKEGFWYPFINQGQCVECGKCQKFCPENRIKEQIPEHIARKAYVGSFKSKKERMESKSGGVCTALARWFLSNDGFVYGVGYSEDLQYACYKFLSDLDEIKEIRGVKYIQPRPIDLNDLEEKLSTGKRVLIIGLPCYISSIVDFFDHRYKNLYSITLICHGPTSNLVQKRTVMKYGRNISEFDIYRKNSNGFAYFYVKSDDILHKEFWRESEYCYVFNKVLRKSCYQCHYKIDNNLSDLLVGDFWEFRRVSNYKKEGNSLVIPLTDRINLNHLREMDFDYEQISFDDNMQRLIPCLHDSLEELPERKSILINLEEGKEINFTVNIACHIRNLLLAYCPAKFIFLIRRLLNK